MSSFEQFNLPPSILKSLKSIGFEVPTPIQEKAIPVGLGNRDVMGMAQTGTGKTGAFGIPLVAKLLDNPTQNVLVLAPTRELAVQIHSFFRQLTHDNQQLPCSLLIGGTSMKQQFREIGKRPRILIATPGRLVDHLNRKRDLLANTGFLVLDEADRMLDMGFQPQLNTIRRFLPRERQTYMFSATFPKNIRQLANEYLRNPIEISVGDSRPVPKIQQTVIETTHKEKNDKLVSELNQRKGSVLIFARTKHRTNRLTKFLIDFGYKASKIHGDCTQPQRKNAIDNFRAGKVRILVATDIASRGLDIADIGHVINYDLPQAPEDYVHRIGRTGRNGKEGQALCLLTPEDRTAWRTIARFAGIAIPMSREEREGKHHSRPAKKPGGGKKHRFPGHGGNGKPSWNRPSGPFHGRMEQRGPS